MTHSSLLNDLIDLHSLLKSDSSTGLDEKKRRDRRVGQTLQQYRKNPSRQIRGWLGEVEIRGSQRAGHDGTQLYHVLCLLLVVLGLATGWGLAVAVLHYRGDAPINIVNAVGLLVLPQVFLLLIWLVATIPGTLPFFNTFQSTLKLLNPGRLARHFTRLFPEKSRQSLAVVWDAENIVALAPASRWLFSFWSQLYAVSFNIGLLLTVFYMISFSDLAFVWSTTLDLENTSFQHILGAISWPWQALFPQAVPGLELVEISRYYRLDEGSLGSGASAADIAPRLGQWWPFLVAAISCYGLLPRLLTLMISWSRFHHHLAHALTRLPGAPELLARMNSPLVSTSAQQAETVFTIDQETRFSKPETHHYRLKCAVIDWAGTGNRSEDMTRQLRNMGLVAQEFFMAGGARSTEQDNATIASLCSRAPEGIVVVVKSWEPPLLEFLDFMRAVRGKCGTRLPVVVLLWGDKNGVTGRDREAWQMILRQLGDPDLHIETVGPAQ